SCLCVAVCCPPWPVAWIRDVVKLRAWNGRNHSSCACRPRGPRHSSVTVPGTGWRSSTCRNQLRRGYPRDEISPVLPMHGVDRLAHLLLHPVETASHLQELVLQAQHVLHAGEVQPELGRELLDQPQLLEVGL